MKITTINLLKKLSNTELTEIYNDDHGHDDESCEVCQEMTNRNLLPSAEEEINNDKMIAETLEDISFAERCEIEKEENFNSSRGVPTN